MRNKNRKGNIENIKQMEINFLHPLPVKGLQRFLASQSFLAAGLQNKPPIKPFFGLVPLSPRVLSR